MIFQDNYKRLKELGFLDVKYLKIENKPFMDLSIERIEKNVISLCHYGEQNGDLMCDPEMTIEINDEFKTAQALYFRNDYIGVEQFVFIYNDDGLKTKVYPKLRKELNIFLKEWLINLKRQGFKVKKWNDRLQLNL